MSTQDLIDAIEAGKTRNMESTFEAIMKEKMENAIDLRRMEISQSMFTSDNADK
jgi:hypothetical protein